MYRKILVPLDGSELAECVLPHLEAISRGCGTQNIVFLRAVEPIHVTASDTYVLSQREVERINSGRETEAKNYLNQLVNRTKYGVNVQSVVMVGQAAGSIAEYATKNEVDLIIVATHGRSGVSRWVWGSVADRILRSACVPVLMVRAPGCTPGI